MKNLNLSTFGVSEMSVAQMQKVDGGMIDFFTISFSWSPFDVDIWLFGFQLC